MVHIYTCRDSALMKDYCLENDINYTSLFLCFPDNSILGPYSAALVMFPKI